METAELDYYLPPDAIAQKAVEPRDSARLLRVEGMTDHRFSELPELLRAGDLLVVNRTRVRTARLRGHKVESGGAVELLLTRRVDERRWTALIRPARRVKPGLALDFGTGMHRIDGVVVTEPRDGVVTVELSSPAGDVDDVLPGIGAIPLPPYFHGRLADAERYQTVFAKSLGSSAAPTAALHFTDALVARLAGAGVGVGIATVELDVGLDTFRPIGTERVEDHTIHTERCAVSADTAAEIDATRRRGGRVVAVGTTVARTLETAARTGEVSPGEWDTDLFITPGYRFGAIDLLLTNFHAPRTTLISLIAAAAGERWRQVYATALERGYRFLSFGDAMLVEGLPRR